MAQLWVRVDGAPRQVSGAVQTASTADLIRALAQATGKTGKFVLAAVDERGPEYLLRSGECPAELLRSLAGQGRDGVRLELRQVREELEQPASAADPMVSSLTAAPASPQKLPRSQSCSSSNMLLQRQGPPDYTHCPAKVLSTQSEQLLTVTDLRDLNLSKRDLENVVAMQAQCIAAQRLEFARLAQRLGSAQDAEYLQLLRQHANLRKALDALRTADWEQRRRAELAELDGVHTAIDCMAAAIQNRNRELNELVRLQRQLTAEISRLKCA